jgi:outer membrane protein assembly factor BamD (BamD/ComL family)
MKRALLLLIPALLALPVQSFALSPGSPGSPEEQATKLYKEATKALNEGRDEAAAEKLREAFRLHRVHEYVCNLGMLELNLGRGPKAAEALFTCRRLLPW